MKTIKFWGVKYNTNELTVLFEISEETIKKSKEIIKKWMTNRTGEAGAHLKCERAVTNRA